MNNTFPKFSSILAPYLSCFLSENMENKGYSKHLADILKNFDNYLIASGHEKFYFTQDDYERWVQHEECNDIHTFGDKQHVLVKFFEYMCRFGQECFIPRPIRVRRSRNEFVPYIYSHDEIQMLFEASDNMRLKRRNHRSILFTMPILLRTLYSTGMRLGEALRLKNKDVRLNEGIFDLNITKNGHQRVCAMNNSLKKCIIQYLEYRNRIPIKGIDADDSPFFVTTIGTSPGKSDVYAIFRRILANSGIPFTGSWKGPNIHSLRHTACVHALIRMVQNGMDMYCNLPILSAYLGHIHCYDTERYIHLAHEVFPDIITKDLAYTNGLDDIIIKTLKSNEEK